MTFTKPTTDAPVIPYFSLAEIAEATGHTKDQVERQLRDGIWGQAMILGGMVFISRQAAADAFARGLRDPHDPRRVAIEHFDAVVADQRAEAIADRARQAKERKFKQSPEGRREQQRAFDAATSRQSEDSDGSSRGRRSRISILNPMRGDGGRSAPRTPDLQISIPALKAADQAINAGRPPAARTGFPVTDEAMASAPSEDTHVGVTP